MGNLRHIIMVTAIFAILVGSALAVNRSIYIWDAASPGAEFQHPDSTSTHLVRPRDGWIDALEAIQADEGREDYAMGDTIIFSYGTSWPSDLNPFSVVIISMGWNDGTGPDDIDATKQAQIMTFLDSTGRIPGNQKAVILEGNDFANLYCDTSSSHYTYAGSFADYAGALLLVDDGGAPDVLFGEDSSFAEGLSFHYAPTPGATTSVDDIVLNDALWDNHHLRYVFNASRKCPARGIQRRSYSPGAVITLPFQLGNIPHGVNTKEQLVARALDFCVMPLPEIVTGLSGETLYVDSLFSLEFQSYDNRCVVKTVIDYSTDCGASWCFLHEVTYPEFHETLDFDIPNHPGAECYFRATSHDSVFNFTSDTSAQFTIFDPTAVGEHPSKPYGAALSAFPNPFNSEVTFRATIDEPAEIQIYSIYGSRMAGFDVEPPNDIVRWDATGKPSGIYLARISGTTERIKLVYLR